MIKLIMVSGIVSVAWLWDSGHLLVWWRRGVAVWRTRRRRRATRRC